MFRKSKKYFRDVILDRNGEIRILNTALYIFLVVTLIWLLVYIVLLFYPISSASFGDSFGGLNTLFSGLAFAGVIVAILLQQKELKESRKELAKQAENQVLSARLQALSALSEFYQSTPNISSKEDARINVSRTIEEIELLLDSLYGGLEGEYRFFEIWEGDLEHDIELLSLNDKDFYIKFNFPKRLYLEYWKKMFEKDESILSNHQSWRLAQQIAKIR